jgi:hypothetical protein
MKSVAINGEGGIRLFGLIDQTVAALPNSTTTTYG